MTQIDKRPVLYAIFLKMLFLAGFKDARCELCERKPFFKTGPIKGTSRTAALPIEKSQSAGKGGESGGLFSARQVL